MNERLAKWALAFALGVILVTFGVSLLRLNSSGDVAKVVVAVVAAVGTILVAFFGIHVADQGRQDAETARRDAETARRDAETARDRAEELHNYEQRRVSRLAATTDPSERAEILNEPPPERPSRVQ